MKNIVVKSKIIKDLLKKVDYKKTEQYKNINSLRRFIVFNKSKKSKNKLNIKDLLFLRSRGKVSVKNLHTILRKEQIKK